MTALDVDITIERGEFRSTIRCATTQRVTGLIGTSGCGKSTLLHAVCGLITPTSGRVVINGTCVFDQTAGVHLRPEKRRIGMVFQDSRLFPNRSVAGNLCYGNTRARTQTDALRLDDVIELLELSQLLQRRTHELSGGERRRVALGRALLSGPDILLLDEPLAGLDDRMKSQIIPLLRRVRDSCSMPMVYVCHDVTELLQMTSHAIVLADGHVVGNGLLREVAQHSGSIATVNDLGFMNVLTCTAATDQNEVGVTLLRLGANNSGASTESSTNIRAPQTSRNLTGDVRIAIRPQDIALSPAVLANISIQNQITGRINRVAQHDHGVLVEIDIGAAILVQITERARASLQIEPGNEVCCLIKSTAIEYLP